MMVMSEEPAEAPTMMAAAWVMETAEDCARSTSRSASVCERSQLLMTLLTRPLCWAQVGGVSGTSWQGRIRKTNSPLQQ